MRYQTITILLPTGSRWRIVANFVLRSPAGRAGNDDQTHRRGKNLLIINNEYENRKEKHGGALPAHDITGDSRGDGKDAQERDAEHQKDGAGMGERMWAEISADIEKGGDAAGWSQGCALLLSHQDGVPVCGHEVQ